MNGKNKGVQKNQTRDLLILKTVTWVRGSEAHKAGLVNAFFSDGTVVTGSAFHASDLGSIPGRNTNEKI